MRKYDEDNTGNVMVAPPKVEERPASSNTTTTTPTATTNDKNAAAKRELAVNIIGWTLQGGVVISAAVILLGVILLPFRPGGFSAQRLLTFPQNLGAVWTGLPTLQPQAVITLGLLLLIATPVMRVAVSIAVFLLEKDRKFVMITLLVLAILLFSLFVVGSLVPTGVHNDVTTMHFSLFVVLFIFISAIAAGLLGSLVGLGGGVLIVPILTLVFGLPIYFAIGASIISVIATSSGAAAAYVRDHMTNLRVGMFLEIATTTGAICGAFLAGMLAPELLSVIFGIILLISAAPLIFKLGEELPGGVKNDRLAQWLKLSSSYPDHHLGKVVFYQVSRTPLGLAMMYVAGLISGLLGIGSGTFKVLAMDTIMRLPMKVSTTTSNFMIGVTAAASAGIYFSRGDIPPMVAAPVALGILIGALVGARLLAHLSNKTLRLIFIPVIAAAAIEMILHGFGIA
ncbi:MAG TPA: TSUP family transporter [Ktedonobacteraceae bacterium]|nr:TSUP family transporter [Ktedonobacteraceae bacterium]